MKFLALFIFSLSLHAFADECSYDPSIISKYNHEQILQYAIAVQKKACINTVLADAKKDPSPQSKILRSAIAINQCEEACTDSDLEQMAKISKEACKEGFIDICAAIIGSEKGMKQGEVENMLKDYCDKNSAHACFHIGINLNQGGKQIGDKYLQKACKLNSIVACRHLKAMEEIREIGKKFQ